MSNDKDLQEVAEAVKDLFRVELQEFRPADFVKVATLLGFHAHEKCDAENTLKPIAESYLPNIIGINLQYAVEAYVWETHVPMTDDGFIVSGFFDPSNSEMPEGYAMDKERKILIRQ